MRSLPFVLVYAAAIALAACGDPPASILAGASGTASAAAPPSSPGAPAPSSVATGPAGSAFAPPHRDLPKDERERELARVLAGEADVRALALVDTEPGEAFDPRLRRALAMPGVMKLVEVTAEGAGAPDLDRAREAVLGRAAKLRGCYAQGLTNNPNLIGTVRVGALLAGAGNPKRVDDAGTDLPDARVLACVVAEVGHISFPPPASSESRLVIRMTFAPGG